MHTIMRLFTILAIGFIAAECRTTYASDKPAFIKQHITANQVADWPGDNTRCRPVALKDVTVSGFLGEHIERNLNPILAAMQSPLPRGFEARAAGKDLPEECMRLAADSDLYKWLEGACYVYARTKNEKVKGEIDRIADLILQCQHEDGYINTQVPPRKRFDPRVNHDLYIAGHFFEAAVAHHRAMGKHNLLLAACRWADYLIREYEKGNSYYKTVGQKEHSEYELGFLRLYRATGAKEYLEFAITLTKMCTIGSKVADVKAGGGLHAVRVGYLLTAAADLYLETGRNDFYQHLPNLWQELIETRMYVTGGFGYRENITRQPYMLPQSVDSHHERDIAESCASIAQMMFAWRLHSITGESKYFDIIETILYNNTLGAVSLDHRGSFYYNPLRVVGDKSNKTDHGYSPCTGRCALPQINRTTCCLPNEIRFFGALPEYIFSHDEQGIYVNLYTSAKIKHFLSYGKEIKLDIDTAYPHNGKVTIRYKGDPDNEFMLRLRIPAWCEDATVKINNDNEKYINQDTYHAIRRKWNPGDIVILNLSMPVEMLISPDWIEYTAGQVVIARGPLVYCLDQDAAKLPVGRARLIQCLEKISDRARVEWQEDLLNGINMITLDGLLAPSEQQIQKAELHRYQPKAVLLKLIPFYARANLSPNSRWVTYIPLAPKP